MTDTLDVLYAERERRRIQEEAEQLSGSLVDFVREAWPTLKPENPYQHNWHIEAVCEHLEAVSRGEILRLQIWVPPVSMKTSLCSILWPAWEWTSRPALKYWTASYENKFSARISSWFRQVILSKWYRERWGRQFSLVREGEYYLMNDKAGTRLATSPEATVGTGEHGHRILIDDPINAAMAERISGTDLQNVNDWYDSTTVTRGIDFDEWVGPHARVMIMQRLHENDLAAYVTADEEWTVLCLPERMIPNHPHLWPLEPRREGELLWPACRDEHASDGLRRKLRHRAAGQLDQMPAAREGEILKRHWWRFYNPKLFTDEKMSDRRPKFQAVIMSVDTPLKDREQNDLIAIQAWGIIGANRYLLDLKKGHMSFSQAKRAILEQSKHVRGLYPRVRHQILIENAGYGVELIEELKQEVTGVTKISRGADGDKILRAESAAADLESGNCYLPGYRMGSDEASMPDDSRNADDIVDFIDNCAVFPNGRFDDDIDAWSQAMNFVRNRTMRRARAYSPFLSPR